MLTDKVCRDIFIVVVFVFCLGVTEVCAGNEGCNMGIFQNLTANPSRPDGWWGTIEITPPERNIYSIIDASGVTPYQFTYIKVKLKNIDSDEIQGGTILAVAYYWLRTDYDSDLLNEPRK